MFRDRQSFYVSPEWRKLLTRIKLERLDDKGQTICEYCNKPITRAYDIIGHHKIELDEDNVMDVNISLNPDNIMLVHHRCHNFIHNKFGYAGRQVFLVYGAPCSGKSTYVAENMQEGDLIIDIDRIWQCVSGLNMYQKPPRLKGIVFRLRDELLNSVKYRLGKWNNCYIIGGYPLRGERERLIKELGARDIFIDTPREECIHRLESSTDGRDKGEWMGYIEEWFIKFNYNQQNAAASADQ